MAQVEEKPLLSLCIPIYNRLSYLERQLTRMLEDKALFEKQIELIISDNCSTDDLHTCCVKFQQLGLRLVYHRNTTNMGADGNFEWCFHNASGQYIWLLGSDDVPVEGVLNIVLEYLKSSCYGLVHLSMCQACQRAKVFNNPDELLLDISYWITFLSANIIKSDSLQSLSLTGYRGTNMIQVPAYLNACLKAESNLIIYNNSFFEEDSDAANNGGYNFFKVFVDSLYSIYQSFVDKGLLSKKTFRRLKRNEYEDFLLNFIIQLLLKRNARKDNFNLQGSWMILFKYYGMCFYAYRLLFHRLFSAAIRRVFAGIK